MWKAEHPGGQHEINALHVPTGRPVQLTMISQDVFHSFSIPDFRVKREVIPGRYSTVWFEATEPGTYHIFCTQYCGTNHSVMIGEVTVLTPDEYQSGRRVRPAVCRWRKMVSGYLPAWDATHAIPEAPQRADRIWPACMGSKLKLANGSVVQVNEAYLRDAILNPSQHVTAGYAANHADLPGPSK